MIALLLGSSQWQKLEMSPGIYIQYSRYSHVHVRLAGSGVQIPLDAQVAVILPAGTNPGLHLKNISAPSVVFSYGSMEPLPGTVESLQLTREGYKVITMPLLD